LDTPDYWEVRYNQVVGDWRLIRILNRFGSFPDETPESTIQWQFGGLVSNIAYALDIDLVSGSETKIIVGGILARYQYDLRSKTDPHFLNTSGLNLIASEAKTHRTFGLGEMWYHGSRGIQILSALYAFNCPTFLFTQRQWKLFVEQWLSEMLFTLAGVDVRSMFMVVIVHTPHVNSSQWEQHF
jgi:hypothetical protein